MKEKTKKKVKGLSPSVIEDKPLKKNAKEFKGNNLFGIGKLKA